MILVVSNLPGLCTSVLSMTPFFFLVSSVGSQDDEDQLVSERADTPVIPANIRFLEDFGIPMEFSSVSFTLFVMYVIM